MDFFKSSTLDPNLMYAQKMAYKFAMLLVLIGGLNWLAVGFAGTDYLKAFLGRKWAGRLYIVVGIAALALFFRRDVYLPFLGETVLPTGALSLHAPQGANDTVTVKTRPGAKVIYWAAEPNPNGTHKELPDYKAAYGDYENAGVAQADDQGNAQLRIRGPPQSYKVPMRFSPLEPHVHFRVEGVKGLFGSIQTIFLGSKKVEGFSDMI